MDYTLCIKLKNDAKPFFGPGPMRLLTLVQQGESLHQASTKLGMAYSKAWRIIRNAEKELGFPLLESQCGGNGGGGSTLTDRAIDLLAKYDRFQTELYRLGDQLYLTHFGEPL